MKKDFNKIKKINDEKQKTLKEGKVVYKEENNEGTNSRV